MKKDLLNIIKAQSDVTNAIVLTHNINFIFIQSLLLQSLQHCGAPSLTIFADAHSAAETFALEAPLLSNLGRRYRVVPVAMSPGFRFHPKAVLLSGRKKAVLLVGSGNLTFCGWRQNAEIWVSYNSDEGTAEISAFRRYLFDLVDRLAINRSIRGEVEEAFDPGTHTWANDLEAPAGLVGRLGSGPPLIDAMRREASRGTSDQLVVFSPYFDAEGEALQQLAAEVGAPDTLVVLDADHTNLPPDVITRLPAGIRIRSGTVSRSRSGGDRYCFVHAKLYALIRADGVTLFAGSANCSRAALTLGDERGNAELMAVRQLSVAEFETEVLNEIEIGSAPPEIRPVESPGPPVQAAHRRPQLLAAREQDGLLEMAFSGDAGWQVEAALIDEATQAVRQPSSDRCECLIASGARMVRLRGRIAGEVVETNDLWIDREASLSSTAYRRSFHSTSRSKAWKSDWDVGDWGDVLEALCQDLEYSPARTATAETNSEGHRRSDEAGGRLFTSEDLFSRELSLPLGKHLQRVASGDRQTSFQKILLHWFGQAFDDEPVGEPVRDEEVGKGAPDEGLDEAVDHPEDLLSTAEDPNDRERKKRKEEQDLKRTRRVVNKMAATMSSAAYLRSRRPIDLARDLKIASTLLRMGASKHWLEREELLATTFQIWSALFLSAGSGDTAGWMAARAKEDFATLQEALGTPSVAAAMFAWSLEIPDEPATPREAQLLLALALSVSRHPWLWISVDLDETASVLADLLKVTADEYDADEIEARWEKLARLGEALWRFEAALAAVSLQELNRRNRQTHIERGELIWQGRLGYCVAGDSAERSKLNIPLLVLHRTDHEPRLFRADLLNPVSGLLKVPDLGVDFAVISALREFVSRLHVGLATEVE